MGFPLSSISPERQLEPVVAGPQRVAVEGDVDSRLWSGSLLLVEPNQIRATSLRAWLDRSEKHPALSGSPRLRRLLRYLIQETLAGRGDGITQYSIAFDCYQIGKDFDSATNTLIRSHARRLRKILKELAESEREIRIVMAEKGYRLCFEVREEASADNARLVRPVLGIFEFDVACAKSAGVELSRIFAREVLMAISGGSLVTAVGPFGRADLGSSVGHSVELAMKRNLDFLLEGFVDEAAGQQVVGIRILDGKSGHQIWATSESLPVGNITRSQVAHIAGSIVAKTTADWGVIPSHVGAVAKARKSGNLSVYEAVVLARQYLSHFDFEHLDRVIEVLRRSASDARDAAIPATLAVLLNMVCGVEPRWTEGLNKSEIRQMAALAARLDPEDPWTRLALSCSAMLEGRRAELLEMGRHAASDPETPVLLLGTLGTLLCTQALELDLAREMIDRYCRQCPRYPRLVHLALAFANLADGDTQGAREELVRFDVPWGWASPLIRAASSALEGDAATAQQEWQRVIEAFPDFTSRWRETVGTQLHESHLTRIFDVLEEAGVPIR